MYPICACDIDADWYYGDHPETEESCFDEDELSLRPRRCCECGDLTRSGASVNHFEGWNPEDREWEIFYTCSTCMAIWNDLCGTQGRSIGSLDSVLWESCGMDLDGQMDDDDECWEEIWQKMVEIDLVRKASQKHA